MEVKTGIAEAVDAAGSQKKLGDALGVTQQSVSLWLTKGYVPNEHIVSIEAQFGVARTRLIDPRLAALVDLPEAAE
jgi:DNA-binding transcriptional regulator YdaS (Cro superfamily)